MAERLTEKFNRNFEVITESIANFTHVREGLPICVVNAVPVAATSSTTMTITMPTDCWIDGIYPTVFTTAGVAVQDAWVDRIDIAGFRIWEMQGSVGPIFAGLTQNSLPQTAQAFHGYARPFKVRQGDVITTTFTSLNAAVLRGTVFVDAYRVDPMHPA